MQLNFLKSIKWKKGITFNHKYKGIGATTLIQENINDKKISEY